VLGRDSTDVVAGSAVAVAVAAVAVGAVAGAVAAVAPAAVAAAAAAAGAATTAGSAVVDSAGLSAGPLVTSVFPTASGGAAPVQRGSIPFCQRNHEPPRTSATSASETIANTGRAG